MNVGGTGGAGSGPTPCPWGDRSSQGDAGLWHSPGANLHWSSSSAKRLRLCHQSNFVWKNFMGFDLKMFKLHLKIRNQTQTCCLTQNNLVLPDFDLLMISNQFSFQIKSLLFIFFEVGNRKLPIHRKKRKYIFLVLFDKPGWIRFSPPLGVRADSPREHPQGSQS